MHKLKVVLLFLLIFSFGSLSFANSASLPGNDERAVVKANNQFAFDLYGKLDSKSGNVFFSPFSIFDALSMTYVGAKGETRTQMEKALHITLSNENFNSAFSKIIKKTSSNVNSGEYTLNMANALWAQEDFHFLKSFLLIIKKYYNGDAFRVNFSNSNVANEINNWADKQTNGKIKEIVGQIDPLTRLILTNAIYFKGKWTSGFGTSTTKSSTFYVNPKQEIKAHMMYQEAKFNYMENKSLQAIEMSYEGGNLSMIVLLPKDRYGMGELEKSLNASNFRKWISEMDEQKVKVYFPKFKIETDYELKQPLESLGMTDAFNDADFSGMDGAKDLHISQVIHKAYIDVNEKGTEAAAVTAVVMTFTCSPNSRPPEIPIFRADHPFIFFIIDRTATSSNGVIMFMGKITNPSS